MLVFSIEIQLFINDEVVNVKLERDQLQQQSNAAFMDCVIRSF
jgi:hypothetical protein